MTESSLAGLMATRYRSITTSRLPSAVFRPSKRTQRSGSGWVNNAVLWAAAKV